MTITPWQMSGFFIMIYPCYLDGEEVNYISSSLNKEIYTSTAKQLKANNGVVFTGVLRNGDGFLVTEKQVNTWLKEDGKNRDVLKKLSSGTSLCNNPNGKTDEWVIDFNEMSLEEASNYYLPFERVRGLVKPEREKKRVKKLRDYWWRFEGIRSGMRKALASLNSYYFAIPEVSKWFLPLPFDLDILQENKGIVIASEDFYVLGLLTSFVHRSWVDVKSSSLGDTTSYTHTACFRTFPFPQQITEEQLRAIRFAMLKLHDYRYERMDREQIGVTEFYNRDFNNYQSILRILHDNLDRLVMEAYGFKDKDDILTELSKLNRQLSEIEESGGQVLGAKDYRFSP